jgi:hypothetical protein
MISLQGRTKRKGIFNSFYSFVTKSKVHKLVSITTDGAKSMTGQVNCFIALCRQPEDFPDFPFLPLHHSPASFGKQETQYKDCHGHSF